MSRAGDREVRSGARTFLSRLRTNIGGNVMYIMALAIIPIIAMVGSAFDMGRAYMVKTRLQQSCDAGALAGRRAMTTDIFDTNSQKQARDFFKFNFPSGTFGTAPNPVFAPRGTADGQVEASASTVVPMTLMRLFDMPSMNVSVNCQAILEVANTDIMFVLDVTQSMNCNVATPNGCTNEASDAKIKALRTAVASFYDTLTSAISDDARLRFGFVPYSTTVNVGKLLPANYLVSSWSYQSRERVDGGSSNTVGTWPDPGDTAGWSNYSSGYTVLSNPTTSSGNCNATNYPFPNPNPSLPTYSAVTSTSTKDTTTTSITTTTTGTRTATQKGEYRRTYTGGRCVIDYKTRTRTETKRDVTVLAWVWHYKRWTPPADAFSAYKAGQSVSLMTGKPATTFGPASAESSSWPGCIEEANTLASASFSGLPVSGAYDLDIDLIPNSEATRWRPAWPAIIYDRNASGTARPDVGPIVTESGSGSGIVKPSGNANACPKAAQKLQKMTKTEVENYLKATNGFVGLGYTYHDAGMIWGARLLSPDGIFGDDNKEVPSGEKGAGKPINRHIIFMTDGVMQPDMASYGLYGLEKLDGRITNGSSDQTARHNSRFSALCESAKAKRMTVWVISFASGLTTPLTKCASAGKAFQANSDKELKEQFENIAAKIAELRLSK